MTEVRRAEVWASLICALGAAPASGGSDSTSSGISAATAQSFVGVYEVQAATENPSACDVEGPSILDSIGERQFVLVDLRMLTVAGLQLASCADDADCAGTAASLRAGGGFAATYAWFFSEEIGPDAVAGGSASSGFMQGGLCTMRSFTDLSLTRQGAGVRLEVRQTALADVPSDDGVCWADFAGQRSEAAGRPCSSLRVLTATRRGPLP